MKDINADQLIGGEELIETPPRRPKNRPGWLSLNTNPFIDLLTAWTVFFEIQLSPIGCTGSSTLRVDTPQVRVFWITAASACSEVFHASED